MDKVICDLTDNKLKQSPINVQPLSTRVKAGRK